MDVRTRRAPPRRDVSPTSRRGLRPVAVTSLRPGVVVLARVPFRDSGEGKIRPGVVAGADRYEVRLLPTTTKPPPASRRLPLRDWQDAGLWRVSWLRRDVVSVSRHDVVRLLGSVSDHDRGMLAACGVVDDAEAARRWRADRARRSRELLGDAAAAEIGLTDDELAPTVPALDSAGDPPPAPTAGGGRGDDDGDGLTRTRPRN